MGGVFRRNSSNLNGAAHMRYGRVGQGIWRSRLANWPGFDTHRIKNKDAGQHNEAQSQQQQKLLEHRGELKDSKIRIRVYFRPTRRYIRLLPVCNLVSHRPGNSFCFPCHKSLHNAYWNFSYFCCFHGGRDDRPVPAEKQIQTIQ